MALAVFVTTLAVGELGPYTVQQFLLDGTSIASSFVGIVQGVFTAIVIVISINQLILQSKFGPLNHQDERLDAVLAHRREVEESADAIGSPTDPAGFIRTAIDATQKQLLQLDDAIDGADTELRDQVSQFVEDVQTEIEPVDAALRGQEFRQIGFLGAAIHWDNTRDLHRAQTLRDRYADELGSGQKQAFEDLLTALKEYEVTREYFRVQYLQLQFVRFTRGMLFTGLPALLVAHYASGIIGPDVFTGRTLGVPDLLWAECVLFTFSMLPALVIISFVARIVTLTLTSVFPGPFSLDIPE